MTIWTLAVVAVFSVLIWKSTQPPSAATRRKVELSLQARGMKLIELKKKTYLRFGRSSRVTLVARTTSVLGPRTEYFDVDFWADAFSRNPSVRELGTYLSPLRDFS